MSPTPQPVNQLVDAVYVLSVRTFADRIAHIRRELAAHAIEFEFIFDFDPNAIPADLAERRFAASDMARSHQSLALKHIASWQRCVERGHRHVLVLEDDAMLHPRFVERFARVMREVDRLSGPYLVYLGRGNNQHVGAARGASALIAAGPLPAADALVFDAESARRRLAYLESHRITRPADWLIREVDAALGIRHFWLREPLVEQGSMNGRFTSLLDAKRTARGRGYAWLRYRWDKWWRGLRRSVRRGQRIESVGPRR